jgi:excisionase family DNA binding protein
MSSNIRMTKTCQYCKKEFEAQTIRTRYCSHKCNSRHYKQLKRNKKIHTAVVKETLQPTGKLITNIDYTSIQTKENLTINEACLLLNITHVTLRRWIKDNIVTSSKVGKKHVIKRSHLDRLIA